MFGARSAVFMRMGRVLLRPSPAIRNFFVLEVFTDCDLNVDDFTCMYVYCSG